MAEDDDLQARDRLLARELQHLHHPVPVLGARARPSRWGWAEKVATPATVLIGVATIVVTTVLSQAQLRTDREQFERTLRQNQYSDIVDGLESSSVGVQVSSIRRLVRYVQDPRNFEDEQARRAGVLDAAQILTVFIQDESAVAEEGLTDYRDPQPIVASRAVHALVQLTADEEFSSLPLDLSRGNFHGNYLPDVDLDGSVIAVGADFRRARVTGWDLRGAGSVDLTAAFFTCADLRVSKLGTATVASTDFTGADLRGADLSDVSGLTPRQLRGARIGDHTQLPDDVDPPPDTGWGVEADEDGGATVQCRDMVEAMTGLVAGAGYSSRFPCSGKGGPPTVRRLSPPRQAVVDRVCAWRADPESGTVVPID